MRVERWCFVAAWVVAGCLAEGGGRGAGDPGQWPPGGGKADDVESDEASCELPTDGPWSCGGLTGTTTNPERNYFTTSFGCWIDDDGNHRGDPSDNCIPACSLASIGCSGKTGPACERELKWFAADTDRFGCGTKLLVTNPDNGKSAVLMAIDRGPNCRIEREVDHWVLDMSYPASNYFFGGPTSARERADVDVIVVGDDVPLGPFDGEPVCGMEGDDDDDDDDGDPKPTPTELCFLGKDRSGNTCFPATPIPAGTTGYDYPDPFQGNANYRRPIAALDLDEISEDTFVAPNFRLGELAQRHKGRYAIVQPHVVERLQNMRDQLGPIRVNSGFRSPQYNAQVDGATHSRHMFGDGFDIVAISAGLSALEDACTAEGGTLIEAATHVHCDWRNVDVDPVFFGSVVRTDDAPSPDFAAELVEHRGVWSVDAEGFDDGPPMLRWTALDKNGEELAVQSGPWFTPPQTAATVRVLVGAQIELEAAP